MGVGALTIVSPGSITAPASLTATVSSAMADPTTATAVFKDYGLSDAILLPSLKAILFTNGIDFQRHVLDAAVYVNGPLAPGVAPDATSTATRATAVLTFTGASNAAARPSNGDQLRLGRTPSTYNGLVTFKTTLDTTSATDQVLIGANVDATISNLTKFINNTGIQGTDYFSARMAFYGTQTPQWDEENDIEVSTSQAYGVPSATTATITFRARTWGSTGNAYLAVEVTDAGAVMSGFTTYMTGGAAGTQAVAGTAPSNGTYKHAIARFRDDDFAQTAISPTDTTQNGGNVDMTVGTFGTPPTRDGISHTRIFRSTVGGGSLFYRAGDTTGSSFTDSVSDVALTGDFAVQYDPRYKRPYTAGYPTRRRFGTIYRGAAFLTGVLPHGKYDDATTVSVTKDSLSATFSSTARYKEDIIGMELLVANDAIAYTVVDFVEATRVATLNRAYEGTTVGTAQYVLKDPRNPFAIDFSVANQFNDWPPQNNIEGVSSTDATGTTGIVTAGDTLVVFTRTGMHRIEGSPDTAFRIVPVAEGCGAYTNQAILNIEGSLLWLGPDGIYEWNGGIPQSLSNPTEAAAGVAKGIAQTLARINPEQVDQIVANYNRTGNIVRWFVPLDDSPWNSHAIVLDLQTGAFSLDKVPPVTAVASIVGPDGDFYTVVGTAFGEVFQLDVGTSDGAYGFDPVASYSSYAASTKTVTLATSPLPTSGDGLKGVPVLKVDADGDVETAYISTNTADTFATVTPFTTAPTTGDKFIFGGIEWRLETSRCDYGMVEARKRLSSVHASFKTQSVAGQVWCYGAKDDDTATVFNRRSDGLADVATLSSLWNGAKRFDLNRGAGRRQMFGFLALCPGFDVKLLSWKAEIDAREEVKA